MKNKRVRKRKVYTIRLPPDQGDVIEELANELGITKSEFIRNALKTYTILKFAEKNGKRLLLEDQSTGKMEWLILS